MDEQFEKYGADLFNEISYSRIIAEDFIASSVFKEKKRIAKLQATLRLFSLISEYNQLDIMVSEFELDTSIETKVIEVVNTCCPGGEIPRSTAMKAIKVEKAAILFFDSWFSLMDGFPKADYLFFLYEAILPALKDCHDFTKTTLVTQVEKWDRSYQCNQILTFSEGNKHLLLNIECYIY